jgi:DNA-binding transcriptional MerR regulator
VGWYGLSRENPGVAGYGSSEIRRLAIILYWQEYALMSLDEIGEILAGSASTRGWTEIVQTRIDALGAQITHMEAAREFLVHVASRHDASPDGCPHFETHIWEHQLLQRSNGGKPSLLGIQLESDPACTAESQGLI